MGKEIGVVRTMVLSASLVLPAAMFFSGGLLVAQAPAPAQAAAARQLGTVTAVAGNSLTLKTDAGQVVTVSVADGIRILQLAPGSTDLKTAQTIALKDIAVGDRVLVNGKAGDDASAFTASRVILMKSGDIAQKHEAEQADWQKRGTGGIVSAVDAGTGTLTIAVGPKKVAVNTSGKTQFRRYAGDSVKFEDAKPGTLAQIQAGDQLRVRGTKSEDGATIQAEEVVSGSFRNLAGTIATVNAAGGTLTLKDLATKKTVTVTVTANSDLRKLPPEVAARFAARAKGGATAGGSGGGGAGAGSGSGSGTANSGGQTAAPSASAAGGGAGSRGPGGMGGPGAAGRSAGGDLSQMLSRLPAGTLADLKVGDAVMVVASQAEPGSQSVTAVTLLSGVEPILAATPSGSPAMTLSPWNVGGGAPDAGGGVQ